jgi:hypothetical protein
MRDELLDMEQAYIVYYTEGTKTLLVGLRKIRTVSVP